MRILYDNLTDDGTLTPSTEATGYPVENVQNQRLSKVWRTTSASAQTMVIALTAAASVNAAAIINHNLTSAASVTVEGNTSDSWPGATSHTCTYNAEMILKYFTATSSYQYWKFTIDDPTNTDAYISIGRIWIGTYLTIDPSSLIDFSVTKKRSDMVAYGKNRQKYASPGTGWREFNLSFPATDYTMISNIETMYDTVGNHGNVIFCNFDTDRTYQIVDPCYCSIVGDMSFKHQKRMRFAYSLTLEEDK